MSFSLTEPQMLALSKTVTRRLGWADLKPGDLVQSVRKGMGLKKGEKVHKLGVIRILDVRNESLHRMFLEPHYGQAEAILEGFPEMTGHDFAVMFSRANGCKMHTLVNRIAFEHLSKSDAQALQATKKPRKSSPKPAPGVK